MSGLTKVSEGNVEIIHHSTSSLYEIIITEDSGGKERIWLDYYEWGYLLKLITIFNANQQP